MNKNVPKLRFKEFEGKGKWEKSLIGNLCTIKTGNKDTQNKIEGGLYPFFVRSQTIEKINSYSFEGEAILTAGDGVGVGKVFHYVDCKFDYHQRVYNLHNFDGIKGRFLYEYFSKNFIKQVRKYNAKTSVDSVRLEMITKMPIHIPSLQEQEKIADFFTIVDSLIEEQDGKVSDLELYKKGMMQKVFSQAIRFKDENGCDYPKWNLTQLSDVSIKISDGIHTTPIYCEKSKFKFINGNNLKNNKVVLGEETKCISESEYLKYKVELNDSTILMSINGTIGNVAYYNFEPVLLGKSAAYININKMLVMKKFIGYILQAESTQRKFYNELTGTTIKNLSLKSIKELKFLKPCLQEQKKITGFLANMDNLLEEEKKNLDDLREMKKGLLQQMFV